MESKLKTKLKTKIMANGEKGSVDQISLDQNCHFSLDQKFHFHLIKFFETFHLIELFDLVSFTRSKDFGTRLKVLKAKNTIIRTFNLVPKNNLQFWTLDQKFLKSNFQLLKLSIKCQNWKLLFWH